MDTFTHRGGQRLRIDGAGIYTETLGDADLLAQVPKAHYLSAPFAGHEAHKDQTAMVVSAVQQFLRRQD